MAGEVETRVVEVELVGVNGLAGEEIERGQRMEPRIDLEFWG